MQGSRNIAVRRSCCKLSEIRGSGGPERQRRKRGTRKSVAAVVFPFRLIPVGRKHIVRDEQFPAYISQIAAKVAN